MLKYLRIRIFSGLLGPTQRFFRQRRMAGLDGLLRRASGRPLKVLDLGGQPEIWDYIDEPLDIVILNLPGVARHASSTHHSIRYVEGDACDLSAYADKSFDLVFSNSVIEHVGDDAKVRAFCGEAMRVGRMLWIQTPARYFPLEPHTGMPLWWYYPAWLRSYFIRKWRAKLPAWTEMVEGTRYIDKRDLQALMPGCEIVTERFLAWPKSYIARMG